MTLWRDEKNKRWALLVWTTQELERVERVRQAMQAALVEHLEPGVTLGVQTGELNVYLDTTGIPDEREAFRAAQATQARLAAHYGLGNLAELQALRLALADDYAARFQDELARELIPGYRPAPVTLRFIPPRYTSYL
jgi:hypothetical protein